MALSISSVNSNSKELSQIESLYNKAFPECERRPLKPLLEDKTGNSEVLSFFNDNIFCGFACLLNYEDISHIIYFAIDEKMRGKGFGTAALKLMCKIKNGYRVIVDIEAPVKSAENLDERLRRKDFYIRNVFCETDVKYTWRQESYEILSFNGNITENDFESFWDGIYSSSPALLIY